MDLAADQGTDTAPYGQGNARRKGRVLQPADRPFRIVGRLSFADYRAAILPSGSGMGDRTRADTVESLDRC